MQKRHLNISCDTCGVEDSEPLHSSAEVAMIMLRQRGWEITHTYDNCKLCVLLSGAS